MARDERDNMSDYAVNRESLSDVLEDLTVERNGLRLGTDHMGYVVFAITHKDNNGRREYYVAAANPNAVQPYVTWAATANPVSFYWGHYFASVDDALADMYVRAS